MLSDSDTLAGVLLTVPNTWLKYQTSSSAVPLLLHPRYGIAPVCEYKAFVICARVYAVVLEG